jgi:integrase
VKNGAELDYPLPEESGALIGRYLERFRHLLAPAESQALFPGRNGGPKSPGTLADQIVKTVFRFVGIRVNPHLFRHIAAKLHLDQHALRAPPAGIPLNCSEWFQRLSPLARPAL